MTNEVKKDRQKAESRTARTVIQQGRKPMDERESRLEGTNKAEEGTRLHVISSQFSIKTSTRGRQAYDRGALVDRDEVLAQQPKLVGENCGIEETVAGE